MEEPDKILLQGRIDQARKVLAENLEWLGDLCKREAEKIRNHPEFRTGKYRGGFIGNDGPRIDRLFANLNEMEDKIRE
jgi:hypothetical protein